MALKEFTLLKNDIAIVVEIGTDAEIQASASPDPITRPNFAWLSDAKYLAMFDTFRGTGWRKISTVALPP
ncbi:hypothetical protein ES702_07392 [subsurface metagenome]